MRINLNLNDSLYVDSGQSIASQDIPLGGLSPITGCAQCLVAAPKNSAVYGGAGVANLSDDTCPDDLSICTANTCTSNKICTCDTDDTCTSDRTIDSGTTLYKYSYSFNISPSAATIEYGSTSGYGSTFYSSSSVTNGGASNTVVIPSSISPLYYKVSCDGYDTQSGTCIGRTLGVTAVAVSLSQSKNWACIVVKDKKTGTAISGVTFTPSGVSFGDCTATTYNNEATTNSEGAVYIWSYSALTQFKVTATHRGRREMSIIGNILPPRLSYTVAVYGIAALVDAIFYLDYCYKPCAYAYDDDDNVCSRKGGVTVSYSSATVSLTTVGTTDSTSADGYGLGEVTFYCQDPIVYVKATLDGYIDYTVVHNEADSPSSNTVANFGLWMYVDYYTGMTIKSITMSNAKGLFHTACGVEFSSNYSRYDSGPYFPMDEGTTLLLEKSDKGKTLTLVFTHRGAGSITKQITIPARTNRSLKTYNTGISVAFTGFNRTLTFGDLYNAEPAEEDYAYAGYDDGVNVTGKLLYEDNDPYATYRGGDPVSSDEVLLLSDVDHYDAQPTN